TANPVTAAWEKARAAGSYAFTSNIVQVTLPSATIANVGRTSRTEKLYLEWQNDLGQDKLEMKLWSDGGSILQTESGIAVKVDHGKTFTRRGTGVWQAADNFTDALAPQGDFRPIYKRCAM